MQSKHPSLEQTNEAADPLGEAPLNARYQPCEVCGQMFDRLEPMLAAYHSTNEHKPLSDSEDA